MSGIESLATLSSVPSHAFDIYELALSAITSRSKKSRIACWNVWFRDKADISTAIHERPLSGASKV